MRVVNGTAGDDQLFPVANEDVLFQGLEGDDTIFVGRGSDSIDGGPGSDWIRYTVAITGNGLTITGVDINLETSEATLPGTDGVIRHLFIDVENIWGSTFNDTLIGDAGNNIFQGDAGNDIIVAGAGNDIIVVGAGNDSADGGAGDDALFAMAGNATLDGGADSDVADFSASEGAAPVFISGVTADLATQTASAVVAGQSYNYLLTSIENLAGSNFNDTLTGDDTANEFQGRNGNDLISGQGGDDIIFAGFGNDTLNGNDGDDQIFAGGGDATIDGGAGTDWALFSTLAGSQPVFRFGVTANLETGTARAVTLGQISDYTFSNVENIEGTLFDDDLTGDAQNNRISGRDGDDVLRGLDGDDILLPGIGNNAIDGGLGDDVLTFNSGAFDSGLDIDISQMTARGSVAGQEFTQTFQGIEVYIGTIFDDLIQGGMGNETLRGDEGNDTIKGGAGDDELFGGLGDDIALYDGASTHFSVSYDFNEMQSYITDRSGAEGRDSRGTNVLRFADRDWTMRNEEDAYLNADILTEDAYRALVELYIAYFDRAPDAEGLYFWTLAFINGTNLDQAAEFFFDQPETRALYGTEIDIPVFVNAVYQNVLGRAADAGGLSFWVGVLDNGSVTEGQFIREFLDGARAAPLPDATPDFIDQQNADRAFLNDKIDIGLYFSTILGMSNVENARDVMSLYDGSSSSLSSVQQAIDEDYQTAIASDGTGEMLIQLVGLVDNPFDPQGV